MIYLDHAATTPVDGRVLREMLPYFAENFGNADSLHAYGRRGVAAADAARDEIASLLGAKPQEIYFTSGGTEADNWALLGAARANAARGKRVLVFAAEHHAVLAAAGALRAEGFAVEEIPSTAEGAADLNALEELLRRPACLVAVMAANNETGVLQPTAEVSRLCRAHGALYFCDAVQAAGSEKLDVNVPHADLLSISAHKFYGPKGAGALYIRTGTRMQPLIAGGHQERGLRGGTTNVPAVVGMAAALRYAAAEREQNNAKVRALRDAFIARILASVAGAQLNGRGERLPGIANFSFEGIAGAAMLQRLDLAGVAASVGAACSSGSAQPSHVLLAMGLSPERAAGGVRFSFGKDNTEADAAAAAEEVIRAAKDLRKS